MKYPPSFISMFGMSLFKKYWVSAFAIGVCTFLFANGSLKENFKHIYRSSNVKSSLRLEKTEMGFEFKNVLNFPYPQGQTDYYNRALIYNAVPASFVVTDLNFDEFVDVCVIQPVYENSILCFYNEQGKRFVGATVDLKLGGKAKSIPSAIYSSDFNNDGLADLLIVSYGHHRLLLRDKLKGFFEAENQWFSNAWGANFADFNQDGFVDVMFANYYSRVNLTEKEVPWYFSGIADGSLGDFNEIWINKGNGKFEVDSQLFKSQYKEHTTAIGVADYNRDGAIDIFESNDYSVDRMYSFNADKKSFVENTEQRIPKIHHGFSGMNAEFSDLNKDGYLDLLVSNIVIPPLVGSANILWMWNQSKQQFEQKAKDLGVDRCGYSWTSKAVDFNLDGENEIVSASGFYSTETSKVNLLFYRLIASATPKWFPSQPMVSNLKDFSISAESRPCLFYKSGAAYSDVSTSVIDWNSHKASRLLVILDVNNDGKLDLIIPEHGGVTQTFINKTETANNWVGIIFKNRYGSLVNFGVKAEVLNADNKVLEYFELNPANGFKSQHDFRKVVGLANNSTASLRLHTSPTASKTFKLMSNQYNEIKIY